MDFVVMGLFEDYAYLSDYLIHPDYMCGVHKWRRIATWSVVDIEVDSQTSRFAGWLAGGRGWPDKTVGYFEKPASPGRDT